MLKSVYQAFLFYIEPNLYFKDDRSSSMKMLHLDRKFEHGRNLEFIGSGIKSMA